MITQLFNLETGQLALLIPIFGMAGGFIIAMTAILSSQWRRVRQAEFDASLKSQMLDQNKTVEEIERVLAAGKSKRDVKRPC